MFRIYVLLFVVSLTAFGNIFAQTGNNHPRPNDKSDIINFHRQILSLKEYNDERAKIPALQKANKVTVKVKGVVDTTDATTDGEDDGKPTNKLTGYIRQELGNETIDLYQLTYDRTKKKITAVVPVSDSTDNRRSIIATGTKKAMSKKNSKKSEDDEDEDEDDKQPQKKGTDKDDDN